MTFRFALALMFAAATPAWACSCSENWSSVKQAWQEAPAVFLGTIETADPDQGDLMFREQYVRIRVDEPFKGVSEGQIIELREGATDCDAKFRTGQRFTFYLYGGTEPESWGVAPCTHSLGNAEFAGDDLLFLRGLPKSAIGTRLSGTVELYEESPMEAFRRIGGIPGVKVKIAGPLGLTRQTVTNASGVYEVFGLQPGKYSVSIQVPKRLKLKFPSVSGSETVRGDETAVELVPNGGVSVDFVLEADTRLSGRILDANGIPLVGVCIDLEPMEGRGPNGARSFDCSGRGGLFEMTMMSPGKYLLVARDKVTVDSSTSESTLYFPGVRAREQALPLSIEPGKYLKSVEIRLPADEKRFRIAGRLQFQDEIPIPSASVTFTSPLHGYSESTQTDSKGSFLLPIIAGMEGQLNARALLMQPILKLCPEFKARLSGAFVAFLDADPISVSSDSDHVDLKLEMPFPSCKSWTPPRLRSAPRK